MPRAFAEVAFTDAVLAKQAEMGSANAYANFLTEEMRTGDRIGPDEAAFIHARDGFYQATVSETGWPYVQFRGGAPGFLRVLDDRTLAYADLRGNRQYLTLGNLSGNDRISLILMDYPNQARLKIWGRAELIPASDAPDLVARIAANTRMAPEHIVKIHVTAFDWNCPRNIPIRLTIEELDPILAPLREKIARLEAENTALRQG